MRMLHRLLISAALLSAFASIATAQPSSGNVCSLNQPAPALPLHTSRQNRRYKLSSVSWYGAESVDFVPGGLQLEPLLTIVHRIRCMGFNSVRLPWSNQMYESNPIVPDYAIAANPILSC